MFGAFPLDFSLMSVSLFVSSFQYTAKKMALFSSLYRIGHESGHQNKLDSIGINVRDVLSKQQTARSSNHKLGFLA